MNMAERIRPPDIGQLRAALAVWHEGSVTRAAARIGLTQPAVSRLVSTLEQDLGFSLFHRERRRLVLTEPGEVFLRAAEASLGGLGRLGALAFELRGGRTGLLRVGAVSALAHGLAPRALAALMRDFPDLAVEVEERDRGEQVEALASRHLDIGLVALPSGAPGMEVEMFGEADTVCLLPAHHPLAARDSLDPNDLAGERFVRLNEMRLLQQLVDDAFDRLGRRRLVSVVVDSTPLMIAFVAGGLGLAITHRMATLALPAGVVARRFTPTLMFGYAALTRAGEAMPAPVRALILYARQVATSLLMPSGISTPASGTRPADR